MINLCHHSTTFAKPERLTVESLWLEHIPFGMCLISMLRPAVLVELGTRYGNAYCAFCQAVKFLDLKSLCYAINNWEDKDIHDLRLHHDPLYSSFSLLLQNKSDLFENTFREKTVDLLHINNSFSYVAIKSDFESWLPKISDRGIVIVHNTNLPIQGNGVKIFFEEVKSSYPHFEFLHGNGLGVIGIGSELNDEILKLFSMDSTDQIVFRNAFETLGKTVLSLAQCKILDTLLAKKEQELLHCQTTNQELRELLQNADNQIHAISTSRSWRFLQTTWSVRRNLNQVLHQLQNWLGFSTGYNAHRTGASTLDPKDEFDREHKAGANGISSNNSADASINNFEVQSREPHSAISVEEISSPATELMSSEIISTCSKQVRERLACLPTDTVRLIALYLPQFHRVPENDHWWGEGFTEWTNTRRATPAFNGHYQPHVPSDLGYYDLDNTDVIERQAVLAKAYGIYGFCYYYYWFSGRRLLEKPIDRMLSSGQPDFPYCFLWANESWTRRWDGKANEILMDQRHSDEDDLNFINNLIPAFEDPRYIRINGRPLLIIYRIGHFTAQSIERWRNECRRAGIGEIYISATISYYPVATSLGARDPRLFGCDAAMEFPPHGFVAPSLKNNLDFSNADFQGDVFDYLQTAMNYISQPETDYPIQRGVMTAWDNTPRWQNKAHIFHPVSPDIYGYWLSNVIEQTIHRHANPEERVIFINAWNEWAEGAHLEPDQKYGHKFLEETLRSLRSHLGDRIET